MLDQATVRKYYEYNPITGDLHRKDKPNSYSAYSITGEYLSFKGKLYSTARVIYTYMVNGELPKVVMRVDRNVRNNKWSNFTSPVLISNNRVTGKAQMRPSAQKRPTRLSKKDLKEMFRWEADTIDPYGIGNLFFIYQGADKLVTKPNITIRGVKYSRMYMLKRVRQLALGWDSLL
jgi:hypothetical protein